ncbi:CBL-interacting protein kinase 6-like [Wolffia australiana]
MAMEEALFSSSSSPETVLQGKYEMGRLLGHGTFAKVYFAREIKTRRAVAVKVFSKEKVIKAGMMDQMKWEIAVMKKVAHKNIVELYEVLASKTKIYFVMELVRGGELFSKISGNGRLRENAAREYFRQLISAVDFCHSRGVYHRDLKLENLLLDDAGNLKVADFGLSAYADHLRSDGLLHTACGTPAYVAPEVVKKKGYDGAKSDIWSCGVLLYVMLAGFLPFQSVNVVAMYRKMQRGDYACPPWFSLEARRIISRMLDPNPETRISMEKLKETRWFKSFGQQSWETRSNEKEKQTEPEKLNAFHIISLSSGLDLSQLFEDGNALRFVTAEPPGVVISRLESVVEGRSGDISVTKCEAGLLMEKQVTGKGGRLSLEVGIFVVAPSVLVVELKKLSGDTTEYRNFCRNELRPALQDIFLCGSPGVF